jgi:phage terminase large subunit
VTNAAAEKIRAWRSDAVLFVREVLGVEPDLWQADALRAVADPSRPRRRVALQACAGPGKTAVLAWVCLWFFLCHGGIGEHPRGAAVAITADNLYANLWAEISKWRERSPLLLAAFEKNTARLFARDHSDTWFFEARSYARSANAEEVGRTLSGIHSEYVLFLLDESGDMPLSIGRTAEQALGRCKVGIVLQAGNPTSRTGLLYESATSAQWKTIQVTGDPDNPKRSDKIGLEWAREQIQKLGRENPWVKAYILGEFPDVGLNQLLGPDEVRAAFARELAPDAYEWVQRRIGVDVARFGDDATVLSPRQGRAAFRQIVKSGLRTDEVAALILASKDAWGSEVEFVDATGIGAGVIDCMTVAGRQGIAVYSSGSPSKPRYYNKRAECWWEMAEWVKSGGCLPEDQLLLEELVAPTYYLDKGRIRIEEKDQIKRRIGRSPDRADALALTFAWADAPAGIGRQVSEVERHGIQGRGLRRALERQGRPAWDYDPLSPERMRS